MCVASDINSDSIITLTLITSFHGVTNAIIVGRRPEPAYSCFVHLLIVSGRLNQRCFHTLFSILLFDVASQSYCAGALSSGMIDVTKIVQCSTFQHLMCAYRGGRERERERERERMSTWVNVNIHDVNICTRACLHDPPIKVVQVLACLHSWQHLTLVVQLVSLLTVKFTKDITTFIIAYFAIKFPPWSSLLAIWDHVTTRQGASLHQHWLDEFP